MNKNDLVDAVAGHVGDRRTAAGAVEAVLGTVMRAVRDGEPVALSGFGVFEKVDRAARSARNPSTGATVAVPATSAPRFRPGQVFKDVVTGKRELSPPPAPMRRTAPAVAKPAVADEPDVQEVADAEPVVEKAVTKRAASNETASKRAASKSPVVKKADAKKADAKKADAKKADAKKADAKKAAASKGKKAGKKAGKK